MDWYLVSLVDDDCDEEDEEGSSRHLVDEGAGQCDVGTRKGGEYSGSALRPINCQDSSCMLHNLILSRLCSAPSLEMFTQNLYTIIDAVTKRRSDEGSDCLHYAVVR